MKTNPRFTSTAAAVLILSLAGTLPGVAQDAEQPAPPPSQTAPSGGWRKFQPQDGQPAAADPLPPPPGPVGSGDPQDQAQAPPPQAPYPQGPQQAYPQQGYPQQAPPPAHYAPTSITLPIGTWVTIRLNEPLSS